MKRSCSESEWASTRRSPANNGRPCSLPNVNKSWRPSNIRWSVRACINTVPSLQANYAFAETRYSRPWTIWMDKGSKSRSTKTCVPTCCTCWIAMLSSSCRIPLSSERTGLHLLPLSSPTYSTLSTWRKSRSGSSTWTTKAGAWSTSRPSARTCTPTTDGPMTRTSSRRYCRIGAASKTPKTSYFNSCSE